MLMAKVEDSVKIFPKGRDSRIRGTQLYMVKPVTKQWTDKEQPLTLQILKFKI